MRDDSYGSPLKALEVDQVSKKFITWFSKYSDFCQRLADESISRREYCKERLCARKRGCVLCSEFGIEWSKRAVHACLRCRKGCVEGAASPEAAP